MDEKRLIIEIPVTKNVKITDNVIEHCKATLLSSKIKKLGLFSKYVECKFEIDKDKVNYFYENIIREEDTLIIAEESLLYFLENAKDLLKIYFGVLIGVVLIYTIIGIVLYYI